LCPCIFLKMSVGKNHPCNSVPRTPSGFCKSCRGPAPNPSIEIENAATRTLLMGELLVSRSQSFKVSKFQSIKVFACGTQSRILPNPRQGPGAPSFSRILREGGDFDLGELAGEVKVPTLAAKSAARMGHPYSLVRLKWATRRCLYPQRLRVAEGRHVLHQHPEEHLRVRNGSFPRL